MNSTSHTTFQTAPVIPDKLFYKIGEVCDIVGVQAHVLRYWESEFPMLQPQKNRAGQRTYRRKDVEMALRIRELLYDEGFTIAGARKKLLGEGRGGTARLKVVSSNTTPAEITLPQPVVSSEAPARELPAAGLLGQSLSRDRLLRLRLMAQDLLTDLKRDS